MEIGKMIKKNEKVYTYLKIMKMILWAKWKKIYRRILK